MKIVKGILDYYPYAMAEGEGAGTAYEYYVKARTLKKVLKKIGLPNNLLIAGLPERYGFSLDFILLSQTLGCQKVVVLDERKQRLERFQEILRQLGEKNLLDCQNSIEIVPQLFPDNLPEFDLFISCEVLQRLSPSDRQRYFNNCLKTTRTGIVFTPNAENPSHATHSKLNTVSLEELTGLARTQGEVINSGYVDLPPFPPGITRSDDQRESAGQGFQRLVFKGVEQWAKAENLFPSSLRRQWAHIVYVAVRRR